MNTTITGYFEDLEVLTASIMQGYGVSYGEALRIAKQELENEEE